MLYGKGKVI